MAGLILSNRKNGLYRDPFALARELFDFDFPRYSAVDKRASFAPKFNVVEAAEAFVIEADLPGVKDADLEISLDGRTLSVSGSRASEETKEGERYHVFERNFGSFTRTFALPDDANIEGISAALNEGVLVVTVPKKPEAKARKIEIK